MEIMCKTKSIFLINCTFINTPLNLSNQSRKLTKQNCFKKNDPGTYNNSVSQMHAVKCGKKIFLRKNNNEKNIPW